MSDYYRADRGYDVDSDDEDVVSSNPRDFFREVLLSYRIIFGQHRPSRRKFNALYGRMLRKALVASDRPPGDALLLKVCGEDCKKVKLFDELQALPATSHYRQKDFPYFGLRLRKLQEFTQEQDPDDLWHLLYDRRDICEYLTLAY